MTLLKYKLYLKELKMFKLTRISWYKVTSQPYINHKKSLNSRFQNSIMLIIYKYFFLRILWLNVNVDIKFSKS